MEGWVVQTTVASRATTALNEAIVSKHVRAALPDSPVFPAGPGGPVKPGRPGLPMRPCGPVNPSDPGLPVAPLAPVAPANVNTHTRASVTTVSTGRHSNISLPFKFR